MAAFLSTGQQKSFVVGSASAFPVFKVSSRHVRAAREYRQARNVTVQAATATLKAPATELSEKQRASSVLAIILGGGKGTRLFPLTSTRAKPAVPIGGAYRLIDVPMSNCINSGINKTYILTQYNSASLNRHLNRTYQRGAGMGAYGGFVEVLAASQTPDGEQWFEGTADAVRQYGWMISDIKNRGIQDVLILSGDCLYRMDYMKLIDKHRKTGADITVGCLPCNYDKASAFGLMKIDDTGRIKEFAEKPKGAALDAMKVDTTVLGLDSEEAAEKPFIASMGLYVFRKEVLLDLLNNKFKDAMDFGGEIIPQSADDLGVYAYLFNDYWEDIGTIKAFFEANLALATYPPAFQFYDPDLPVFTAARNLPPAKIVKSQAHDCIISQGSYLYECNVDNAVIGLRSRILSGCQIKDSLLMGADYYETPEQRAKLAAEGQVPLGVGEDTYIQNAIVDKNARIGANCQIVNKSGLDEADRLEDGFCIRSGIVCVLANTTMKVGTKI